MCFGKSVKNSIFVTQEKIHRIIKFFDILIRRDVFLSFKYQIL